MHLNDLLNKVIEIDASDLHLRADEPPIFRVRGELIRGDMAPLSGTQIRDLMYAVLDQDRIDRFEKQRELDVAHEVPGKARFRVNIFFQQKQVGAALRLIPYLIRSVDELGMPQSVKQMCMRPRGLILVTGPTGSGKSTSLAAMIDYINRNRKCHILTIEEPIEYMHTDRMSVINQREVHVDTHSYADALRHVMRQNPDVILVGEMRDLETIHLAITAAETGHLVFSTLHTQDAPQTVDRIIDVFPPEAQAQIRMQLSVTLNAVISQTLLARADTSGRIAAYEMMIATPAIRSLIREGKTHQLYMDIQTGGDIGMQSLDSHLLSLVNEGKIKYEDGIQRSSNPSDFRQRAQKLGIIPADPPAQKAR